MHLHQRHPNGILFTDFFYQDYWPMVLEVAQRGYLPITNTPALSGLLQQRGLPALDWQRFMPKDLQAQAQQAVSFVGEQVGTLLNQPEAVAAFNYAGGNMLAHSGRTFLRQLLQSVGHQYAVIETLEVMFTVCDIRLVVMRSNMSATQRVIQQVAEQKGARVLELAHGNVSRWPYEVDLSISRHLPCDYAHYGPRDADVLVEYGNPPERLFNTGAPIWDAFYHPSARISKAEARANLGLDADRPVVLYLGSYTTGEKALYPAEMEGLHAMYQTFVAGLRPFGSAVQVVVRPHPGEIRSGVAGRQGPAVEAYRQRMALEGLALTNVDVSDHSICANKINLFRAADAIVVSGKGSSVITEAMILERPVVLLDGQDGQSLFTDGDGMLEAEDGPSLTAILEALIGDTAFAAQHVARQRALVPGFNAGDDGRASQRVAALVHTLIQDQDVSGLNWAA